MYVSGIYDVDSIVNYFCELMYLTNEYAADELKSICVGVMKDRIENDLLLWTLELAIDCNSVELHDICLKQIKGNWLEAIRSDWFPHMQHKALEDILRVDCAQRNEKILFERCIEWAKRMCEENKEPNANAPVNLHTVLDGILDLIRFENMTKDEFESLKGTEICLAPEIGTTDAKVNISKKFMFK